MSYPKRTIAERLERYSIPEPNSGCWLWTGGIARGYGHIDVDGKAKKAHRVSWEHHRGPIPPGVGVFHRCDNRACINPDHLFLGTHQDNMDDKTRKGRQSRGAAHSAIMLRVAAKGTNNGYAKLTEEQVRVIYAAPGRIADIGRRFGVVGSVVSAIKRGETWRHLELARSAEATRRQEMKL